MKKVILDTSFLLVPYQFNIDIINEIERICDFQYGLFIVDKTIDEIQSIIKKQKGKNVEAAKFAIEIIKKEGIQLIPTTDKTETYKNVDNLILNLVNTEDYAVATQDKALKSKLRRKNIRIIELRQKKHLMID